MPYSDTSWISQLYQMMASVRWQYVMSEIPVVDDYNDSHCNHQPQTTNGHKHEIFNKMNLCQDGTRWFDNIVVQYVILNYAYITYKCIMMNFESDDDSAMDMITTAQHARWDWLLDMVSYYKYMCVNFKYVLYET